jgi:hypothetical protein
MVLSRRSGYSDHHQMPNWVDQDLHVVGPKADIDRFIRMGFRATHRRDDPAGSGEFLFKRLCPLRRSQPKDTYTHDTGDVLMHCRTRTEAFFGMRTSWDYPAAFYARLPQRWPNLMFFGSVKEDMGLCGGVIVVMNGEVHNVVRDYDAAYNPRQHRRDVLAILKRLAVVLVEGRPWRLLPDEVWQHRYLPFDAWFDDAWWFYFRTHKEMTAFAARYRPSRPMRLVSGVWRPSALRRT